MSFAAGAFHTVSAGWRPVCNLHTLRMLERHEFIKVPLAYGKRGRSAIGPTVHRYVFEGDKADGMRPFRVGKREFRLQWADGCFHPFVWEWRSAK